MKMAYPEKYGGGDAVESLCDLVREKADSGDTAKTRSDGDLCDLFFLNQKNLNESPSELKSWENLAMNSVQMATTTILKTGLDQLSWEPLAGLLEDLATTGVVSRDKVHKCATQVILRILGPDLKHRVLQQYHSDQSKAEFIMIKSLIIAYIQDLRTESRVQSFVFDAPRKLQSVELIETKSNKKKCGGRDRKQPSYLKMTESFKRKLRTKKTDLRAQAQTISTRPEQRELIVTKKDVVRTKLCNSIGDQTKKKSFNVLRSNEEVTDTQNRLFSDGGFEEEDKQRPNSACEREWNDIELETAVDKYPTSNCSNKHKTVTKLVDDSSERSSSNESTGRTGNDPTESSCHIFDHIDKIPLRRKKSHLNLKIDETNKSDQRAFCEIDDQVAYNSDADSSGAVNFSYQLANVENSIKNKTSRSVSDESNIEEEIQKSHDAGGTWEPASETKIDWSEASSHCESSSKGNSTNSGEGIIADGPSSADDAQTLSVIDNLTDLRISNELMTILKRQLITRNRLSLEHHGNAPTDKSDSSAVLLEMETMRMFNLKVVKRLNMLFALSVLVLVSSVFTVTALSGYTTYCHVSTSALDLVKNTADWLVCRWCR